MEQLQAAREELARAERWLAFQRRRLGARVAQAEERVECARAVVEGWEEAARRALAAS